MPHGRLRCQPDAVHPPRVLLKLQIRTQKFIEFTEKDLEERDRKLRQVETRTQRL